MTSPPQVLGRDRLAVYELTTPDLSFDEDVELYAELAVGGIGICEIKLPADRDDALRERVLASGLKVAACLPCVDSILPQPLVAGPPDPADRVDALCRGITRLAAFNPSAIICTTGPPGDYSLAEARTIVVDGLRNAAAVASALGVKLALEPIHEIIATDWSMVTNLSDTIDLLDEVDRDTIGVLVDSWHLWNTSGFAETARANIGRIVGVHVSDWRDPPRSWCDRLLPGHGMIDFRSFVGTLEEAGYRGTYDLEIFSDDGRHGVELPDSLWKLPPRELIARASDSFFEALGN
jgi:sugar phosphate isomerase/epimerase